MEVLRLRWKRIDESNLSFDNIKTVIKDIYNEDVTENNLREFLNNISKYKNIKEGNLISLIEDISYNKLNLFSIKLDDSNPMNYIRDALGTDIGRAAFSKTNRININNINLSIDDIETSIYMVSNYKFNENDIVEIDLCAIKEYSNNAIDQSGVESVKVENAFDITKFLIDLKNDLVFMLYTDIDISNTKGPDVTSRKKAFMNLFQRVNSKNLIKCDISDDLTEYVNEYIVDKLNNKSSNKLISCIKTSSLNKSRSSLESVEDDFNHSTTRLTAIKEDLDANTHVVSLLECIINSKVIKFKNTGEINLHSCTFQAEVIKDVCNGFFKGKYLC